MRVIEWSKLLNRFLLIYRFSHLRLKQSKIWGSAEKNMELNPNKSWSFSKAVSWFIFLKGQDLGISVGGLKKPGQRILFLYVLKHGKNLDQVRAPHAQMLGSMTREIQAFILFCPGRHRLHMEMEAGTFQQS